MTLYELTNEYQQLLLVAEDPDVDPQVIADTLEGLTGEIEDKADNYARVIKQLDADSIALKAEIDRLSTRKKSIENNIDRMKESLKNAMIACNKTKFKTNLFTFSIQSNPEKVVLDSELIPEEYLIPQEPKVNKTLLKEALHDLESANKLTGIAHLERDESLRIR